MLSADSKEIPLGIHGGLTFSVIFSILWNNKKTRELIEFFIVNYAMFLMHSKLLISLKEKKIDFYSIFYVTLPLK